MFENFVNICENVNISENNRCVFHKAYITRFSLTI